ncbi:hypothetical protein BDQ12DRAFT_262446 [Crucibulum laeve]|uniref:Uncharacterized protein n=1 Tax=Crucibulum laeve TaxID=68775 RepID=A0A5C3LTV2_9AGAR|nr:hypothetical protein BDQ12DRAFT_262446 [Crucibulum laeve]
MYRTLNASVLILADPRVPMVLYADKPLERLRLRKPCRFGLWSFVVHHRRLASSASKLPRYYQFVYASISFFLHLRSSPACKIIDARNSSLLSLTYTAL